MELTNPDTSIIKYNIEIYVFNSFKYEARSKLILIFPMQAEYLRLCVNFELYFAIRGFPRNNSTQ